MTNVRVVMCSLRTVAFVRAKHVSLALFGIALQMSVRTLFAKFSIASSVMSVGSRRVTDVQTTFGFRLVTHVSMRSA